LPSSATSPCISRPHNRSMYSLPFIHFWRRFSPEAASTALRIGQTPRRPDRSGAETLGTITRPQVGGKSDGTRMRPAHNRSSILRSRGQRTAAEGLGRRRCRVAMPSQDKYASGIVLPRGSEKCQNRSRFAPSIRRSLADRASQSRLIHTREGTA
jgi:hypothetical protein